MKYRESEITPYLMHWYEYNARVLPWRESKNPYYIWISEIMLQQTRIEAVRGYFARFIDAFPDVSSLAAADEDRLMKLWEGLGYYNRARNLKKAAERIMEKYEGRIPDTVEELLTLPGIGAYTAGAIASIAYNKAAPAVDGNVLRVIMRLRGSDADITKESVKKEVAQSLAGIMPADQPGNFTQALMELGEVVCIPNGKPLCEQCPLMHLCTAFHEGTTGQIPKKAEKKSRRIEKRTVFVIRCDGQYILHRRGEKGLLAGLWEFPNTEGHLVKKGVNEWFEQLGYRPLFVKSLGSAKHVFSHVEWHMKGYLVELFTDTAKRTEPEMSCVVAEKETQYRKKDSIRVSKKELLEHYSVPTAFSFYKNKIE